MLQVRIITPQHIIYDSSQVIAATVPTMLGEMQILPQHSKLLSQLTEGIIKIVDNAQQEKFFTIGSGYARTDGKLLDILVSRVYKEEDLNENLINEAIANAQSIAETAANEKERAAALATIRHSHFNLKLLKRRRTA